MAEMTNSFTAFNDRNQHLVVRSVADRLWYCQPEDTVLQQLLPTNGNGMFEFNSITDCKYEWMETGDIPTTAMITETFAAPTSTGVDCYDHPTYDYINIRVDHPEYFHRGNVLKICPPAGTPYCDPVTGECDPGQTVAGPGQRDMFVWVESRDCASGTLTVYPGWAGTPVYEIPIGTQICLMYTVAEECPEHVNNYIVSATSNENYFQLFHTGWEYTEKSRIKEYYGLGTADQAMERHRRQLMGGSVNGARFTGKLPRELENALLYGVPHPGGPTGKSAMGGINSFGIPEYCVDNLNYELFRDILSEITFSGGMIGDNTIVLIPHHVQKIIDDWGDCRNCETGPENTSFGVRINTLVTSYGTIGFTPHRQLASNEIYILDRTKMGIITPPGDWNWTEKELPNPQTSLCHNFETYGMFGFALACPCHHAKITMRSACGCAESCCPHNPCYDEPGTPDPMCEPGVPV